MKKSIKGIVIAGAVLTSLFTVGAQAQHVNAKSYSKAVTKIAGTKNYPIYHKVTKNGPSGKFTSTSYFKYGQIQSKQYISTKKGNFWNIIVDGRPVGWVSENFFARNTISVANDVSLVKNSDYSFNTRDTINYATDSHGTAIDPDRVQVSQASVSTKATTVNYSYGKAKASVNIDVRSGNGEMGEANVTSKSGFKATTTWNGVSKGSSRNWNAAHHYTSETTSNTFKSSGLTLRTRLF